MFFKSFLWYIWHIKFEFEFEAACHKVVTVCQRHQEDPGPTAAMGGPNGSPNILPSDVVLKPGQGNATTYCACLTIIFKLIFQKRASVNEGDIFVALAAHNYKI